MPTRLTDAQTNEVIKLYKDGLQRQDIATKVGIHSNSIGRILRNNGIERTRVKQVSDENIARIIKEYSEGISSEIIADNMDIDGTTVCRILKRNNIKLRPATANKRQYKINEDYFEKIDTEEKAYFLGFLYADGHITSGKGKSITLSLQKADIHILETLSIAIYGFKKIDLD
jgi:DNA invertase Pin-like site-specific DNA recombinase